MKKYIILTNLFFLSACSNYLYVQQQKVDCTSLASVYVDTPDPRKDCPPCGQRLVIHWDYADCKKVGKLFLNAKVVFWDLSEKNFYKSISKNRSSTDFYFPIDPCNKNPILTYKITIETEDGIIVDTWEHKLWVEVLHLPLET